MTPTSYLGKVKLSCTQKKENCNLKDMLADCLNCEKVRIEILNLEYSTIASLIPEIKIVKKKI